VADKHSWIELRLGFITDASQPSLREYAGRIGIKEKTVQNVASREKWLALREAHWEKVGERAGEKITDLQSTVMARDTSQQLAQIQAMKLNALKYAGGVEGKSAAYEKPHEAVAAYERLVKLERLILGESTEHIKIDDARAFARDVLTIVREEVLDHDVLDRIAQRLQSLAVSGQRDVGNALPALN